MLGGENVKIKYIGSVNKVMLPGIPGTFTTGMVYEVSDKIGWQILTNPLFICMDDDLWVDDEFWLTGEKVDEPEKLPWQLKDQEVEIPVEEAPEIEEAPKEEEPVEEPPKRTRRKRTPKEPPKEVETPEGDLTEPLEEKEKEKEVNTNGS